MNDADDATLLQWFGSGGWNVDFARVSGDALAFGGWILPAPGLAPVDVRINGRRPDWITSRIVVPQLKVPFPFHPDAVHAGFRARATLGAEELAAAEVAIDCVSATTGEPMWPAQRVFVPSLRAADAALALPDPRRVDRISGTDSADLYRLEGSSIAHTLRATFARHGVPLSSARVLDWGTGCGRVARFIAPGIADRFVGVDIDGDNVGWCRAHLPGRYEVVGLSPPLEHADASFDALFGISVLTHLAHAPAAAWIGELARVLRPGGLALVSVHGRQAASRVLRGESIRAYDVAGFLFGKTPHALDAIVGDDTYYGTAFHGEDYVRRTWSAAFDVIEIVPAAIGNHQDLVVLRKRS